MGVPNSSWSIPFFLHQNVIYLLKYISEKSEINELLMPVALISTFWGYYKLESGMQF